MLTVIGAAQEAEKVFVHMTEEKHEHQDEPKEVEFKLEKCGPCDGTGEIKVHDGADGAPAVHQCRDCAGEGKVRVPPKVPAIPASFTVNLDSGKIMRMRGHFELIQWPLAKVVHIGEEKATLLNFDKIESVDIQPLAKIAEPLVSIHKTVPKKKA